MSEDRLERIRDRIITMRKRLAEFPWKDWDAGRVAELVDEEEYLISEVEQLREKYKVHENKYAVPLVWKSDSRPGQEFEGFVVGVDEGAGIRALVQENATLMEEVKRLQYFAPEGE